MRRLEKPTYDVLEFYRTCISGVRSIELKQRLNTWSQRVVDAAELYDRYSKNNKLFEVISMQKKEAANHSVPFISKYESKNLYEYQVAKIGRPGRAVYSELLITKNKKCPFCTVGKVKNLDHFLPKAHFPIYAVTPVNLVPSCRDCNLDKNADVAIDARKQTLHPYYDDASAEQWLFAKVAIESCPPVIEYFTDSSHIKSPELALKVQAHFIAYGLSETFTDYAADRLGEIYVDCKNRFNREGSEELKKFLLEQKISCENDYKNSWSLAMYGALASSEWYCNGGFIEKKRD